MRCTGSARPEALLAWLVGWLLRVGSGQLSGCPVAGCCLAEARQQNYSNLSPSLHRCRCSCCNHSCAPSAEAFKRDEDDDGSGAGWLPLWNTGCASCRLLGGVRHLHRTAATCVVSLPSS